MIEADEFPQVELNPNYGNGCFRRRIRLHGSANAVRAEMEDDYHAFRLQIEHSGGRLTAVTGESLRAPTDACPEAPALLRKFVGIPIDGDRQRFRAHANPRLHCTHLHDLLWLAVSHACRGHGARQYDVEVGDARAGISVLKVELDERPLLFWACGDGVLVAPVEYSGQSIREGFSRWAAQTLSGDLLEAAYIVQICALIATARRFDVNQMRAGRREPARALRGACHAFQPEVAPRATPRIGNTRDFTQVPDELLLFRQ
ncbi:DUF2889 domain-containing protein [Pseudomonas nicosulfuronedens]|uniref:DUF2889 domain-containing protein n=1 Tax=Pseudomonas nicosulfuronedens TaxID=2571105 RepID=A0A5R9QM48_9PSED|nr:MULTISPECIES: DUF2889 domain-containing protein [Pseudomonas]TLX70633.1 DUF2889 domain-containing protein [Pseudomonas nicosulfuronedens]